MTANELADKLERMIPALPLKALIKSATMLRQQQAEIQTLKMDIHSLTYGERLAKHLNKPVAIRFNFDGYGYQYMDSGSGSDWQTRVIGEPLYTHPMRELSDEEILDLCPPNHSDMMNEAYTIDFAKAILRKASEK